MESPTQDAKRRKSGAAAKENSGHAAPGEDAAAEGLLLRPRFDNRRALGKQFKPPLASRPDANGAGLALGLKRPVGPQGMLSLLTRTVEVQPKPVVADTEGADAPEVVLFDPADHPDLPVVEGAPAYARVVAAPFLAAKLRPHQVEGVQFMYRCLTGLQDARFSGCIQSDSMGLGKSFQSVATLWTLLCSGLRGAPACSRVLILSPSSLVTNWARELAKWLGDRIKPLVMEDTTAPAVKKVLAMVPPPAHHAGRQRPLVLICSYTTFRMHRHAIYGKGFELLICDEAHQLKNSASQIAQAVGELPCKMRLLLTGTPLQNDLSEYYTMFSLANPGLLGTQAQFNRAYQNPVLAGRDATATEKQMEHGAACERALVEVCSRFMLRRTGAVLKKYLPPKTQCVVFCRMAALQLALYRGFLASEPVAAALEGRKLERGAALSTLPAITALKKLCCHPALIHGLCNPGGGGGGSSSGGVRALSGGVRAASAAAAQRSASGSAAGRVITGFEGLGGVFASVHPPHVPGRVQALHSGKVAVMQALLRSIRQVAPTDKVVLVSNYTETLDLMGSVCAANGWATLRLDGSNSVKSRQPLVDSFNDAAHPSYVLLLSSKAGGVGLNIIGANRLILSDSDWNPANDLQAMARVWREGQTKRVYIYRMITAGSIEEKIFQRQLAKEGLSRVVVDDNAAHESRTFSRDELRALFRVNPSALCDTHDAIKCGCDGAGGGTKGDNAEGAAADSILAWEHVRSVRGLPDEAWSKMPEAALANVTFAFSDHNLEDGAHKEKGGDAEAEDGDDAASDDGSIDRSGCQDEMEDFGACDDWLDDADFGARSCSDDD